MTTWFITGTSTGFGRIMAEKLIARGDRVAATARDLHAIEALACWKAALDVAGSR